MARLAAWMIGWLADFPHRVSIACIALLDKWTVLHSVAPINTAWSSGVGLGDNLCTMNGVRVAYTGVKHLLIPGAKGGCGVMYVLY